MRGIDSAARRADPSLVRLRQARRVAVVEEPRSEDVEEHEEHLLPVLAQPDEQRWWELQLGVILPERLYTETATGP